MVINNEIQTRESNNDIKRIIHLIFRQWYWFALFGILGLGAAFLYNKLTTTQYFVNTTILIPESSQGVDFQSLFSGSDWGKPKNNIYNQIEIIKSYKTISQTLLNLNWRTSWYKKDLFIWKGIYKQEPFDVQEAKNFVNPSGVKIYITPISDDAYTVEVNGDVWGNSDVPEKVKFEEHGEFGKPFVHNQFNFTILKKSNEPDIRNQKYCFYFNNLNSSTLSYQNRLNADLMDKNSDIIQCSLQGEQPEKEGEFLNELIKVYIQNKMSSQNEAQKRSLEFINSQLSGISDSLNLASNKFTEFKSKNSIVDLSAEGTMVMNNMKEIETERAQSQIQLDYFNNLLKYLNSNSDLQQLVAPSVVGIQDAALNSLVLKLTDLYNRRQIISFSAKENNPTLVMVDKEIDQIRNQLVENVKNLINNATASIDALKDRQAKISSQINKLPQKEQQMVNIQRQFTLTNDLYNFLLQKRAETNITLASTLPDVQVIDISRPETASEIGLSSKIILIIGFLLGSALPLAYIMLVNYFDDRIRTQEDVEKFSSLPVLGTIMHNPDKSELTVYSNPKTNIAESFRALRTNLHFMISGPNAKVISVHSPNPGEGKSFVTTNLASILAMNNNKVLLIGADLRKPKLQKNFNQPNDHGLSTYLIGYDTFENIIFPTKIENLYLLPSGPIPPNPAEILGNPEMEKLLEEAKRKFDYIIIDNAPIGLVTDGFIVGRLSDLNIFVLRYGFSQKHELELLNQYAIKKLINNPAIVVNDIKYNVLGYTYYKYYKYEDYRKTYYSSAEDETKTYRKKKLKAS